MQKHFSNFIEIALVLLSGYSVFKDCVYFLIKGLNNRDYSNMSKLKL